MTFPILGDLFASTPTSNKAYVKGAAGQYCATAVFNFFITLAIISTCLIFFLITNMGELEMLSLRWNCKLQPMEPWQFNCNFKVSFALKKNLLDHPSGTGTDRGSMLAWEPISAPALLGLLDGGSSGWRGGDPAHTVTSACRDRD